MALVLLFGDPNKMPNGPHGLVMPQVGRVPDDRILEVCHKEDPCELFTSDHPAATCS